MNRLVKTEIRRFPEAFSVVLLIALTSVIALCQEPGSLLWTASIAGQNYSSPAIGSDGTIYIGSSYTDLYAFSPLGETNWIFHTGGDVFSSPAIGPDETIYVGSMNGIFYSIHPDGSTNWALPLGDDVRSSPAIGSDGTIYIRIVTNSVDRLFALNPAGVLGWVCDLALGVTGQGPSVQASSPAIGPNGTIYVASSASQRLYAINQDGTTNWIFNLGGPTYSSPAVGSDGTIYMGGDAGILYAIDPSGSKKWQFTTGPMESSPAVAGDGTIYAAALYDTLFALDPNGVPKWSIKRRGGFSSSPAIASDGTVFIGSYNGSEIYVLSQTGTQIKSLVARNNFSSPAIGPDGMVYYGADTSLSAVYYTNSLQTSSWPMFRRDARHNARSIQRGIGKPFVLLDASIGMAFTVETGRTYRLLTSTDLVSWVSWTNFAPTNFAVPFVDSTATNFSNRYYRLATP